MGRATHCECWKAETNLDRGDVDCGCGWGQLCDARRTSEELRRRFRFFLEHSGWATPPGRAACALGLARAEELLERAEELELAEARWVEDCEPYDPGDSATVEEAARRFDSGEWSGPFGCVLAVRGEPVASLWGIVVGSRGTGDPYCRVIAAELASEHVAELRSALRPRRLVRTVAMLAS